MKRSVKALMALSACALAFLGAAIIFMSANRLKIEFFEDAEVGLNEAADNLQFIKSVEHGKVVTERAPIDTSTAGEKDVFITVKPSFGPEKVYHISVFVVDRESPEITCGDHIETELGADIDLLAGVSATDNSGAELAVTVEGSYDINTVGEYKLKYVAVDPSRNRAEAEFTLSVVDREAPKITCGDHIETDTGADIDLLAGVFASDNSGEKIAVTVEGSYDINKAGEYKLKYVAVDPSGNRTEAEFTLSVRTVIPPPPSGTQGLGDPNPVTETFTTSKGFTGVVKGGVTYIEGYLIANKTYSLPESYGSGLTAETYAAFSDMAAAAAADGINIYIVSGFRSYAFQGGLYNNYVLMDGKDAADTYSARAGHSEHQSGLAFDLNTTDRSFGETREGIWLSENCWKYGFILRYPKGKTDETGYIYEPWHFRFVGTDLAPMLYNGGDWITLETFFGITSEYR